MQQCFSLLIAAIFLSMVPVSGWAQKDPGIPPMLENRRPMAVPAAKLPAVEQPKATATTKAKKSKKAKSAKSAKKSKKRKKSKGRLATKKTKKPAAKKKGVSAKPRSKSKANSS
jgi:hypothetical protein